MGPVMDSNLGDLRLLSKGKVRDIYATSDPNLLLFVASDRISAYDVILRNGVPGKGKVLTKISLFWFEKLKHVIPTHLVTADVDAMPAEVRPHKDVLDGRAMLVRRARVVPLEAIVRGYITGSAWAEYKTSGTVHGLALPAGLVESQKLPEPLFTPSTKAAQGQHDENISPAQAESLVGPELYAKIERAALQLYKEAADYALSRGLILADTKFEFGLVPRRGSEPSTSSGGPNEKNENGNGKREEGEEGGEEELILVDEVLTPDSSRYWPAAAYAPGGPQPSFDKQFLRDWLTRAGFRKGREAGPEGGKGEGWVMDADVVEGTRRRYEEALELLTGEGL